jgi:hypothetical protein
VSAVVVAGVVAALVAAAAPIVIRVRRAQARNAAFLAQAVATGDAPADAPVVLEVPTVEGGSYAVWLDMVLRGPSEPTFELALAITVDGKSVVDHVFPVAFDDEQDAKGLPPGNGITALNTRVSGFGSSTKIATVLRAFSVSTVRPGRATIRARVTPGPDVTFERMRVLITDRPVP